MNLDKNALLHPEHPHKYTRTVSSPPVPLLTQHQRNITEEMRTHIVIHVVSLSSIT